MDKIILMVDSRHGQYCPKIFIEEIFIDKWSGISKEDVEVLLNPENEDYQDYYWDTWDRVLNNAYLIHNGIKYSIHHNGDIYLIAYDLMTREDTTEFFGEYYE